ncbi:MAG: metallophosphoesterase [Bacteroidota bacterium]
MRLTWLAIFLLTVGISHAQTMHVYLLGDAGQPVPPDGPNLKFLSEKLSEGTAEDVLLILGDNVYPNGLPPDEHPKRKQAEDRLNAQLDVIKNFKGRSYMVPGNHDWADGKKNGLDWVLRMQEYVEKYLANTTTFLPRGGCPGPVEIELNKKVTLILLNTQYYVHPWDKPGAQSDCEQKSTFESMLELSDAIKRNSNKHIIVAGHHPVYSYGAHGGYYTFRQHLFPLTDVNRKLWIPMPVVGSIYPLYRQLIGSRQELKNSTYKMVRKDMEEAFAQNENLVYVAGHEHSLQYIRSGDDHHIVSGSGSKASPIRKGEKTVYYHEGIGFASLTYEDYKKVSVQFWDGINKKLIFEKDIYEKTVEPNKTLLINYDFKDSIVHLPISTQYHATTFQKKMLGGNYRDLWATPVDIPVFNIGKEHGGLEIKKSGGRTQTRSLRLESKDGKQYVLRSLDKYTDKILPAALKKTLAADILQDEISTANPYGAFIAPYIADAVGIYHSNPKIVYIPNDPRFRDYKDLFAGQVMIYEERPTDESANEPYFGSGEKVLSTLDVVDKLHKDNDDYVDQPFVLRSRLVDNVLGDWDRHDDQWRWVQIDKKHAKMFRPIPRDRDQVFFINEGIIPSIASRKWALPFTEGFRENVRWAPGFNYNGRFFDRSFLNDLEWSEWEKGIKELQSVLTDDVIEQAFTHWPDTIQKQVAKRTIEIMKKRRDNLVTSARGHYLFISKEVEVMGSDKHELFQVDRLNDEDTRVTVWKRSKEGKLDHEIFNRVFKTSETREVRLYGLGGEDIFNITGKVHKGIGIRIIGGSDKDKISDSSKVSGPQHKTLVYDLRKNTTVEQSSETSARLSNNVDVNAYNRTAFKYDKLMPVFSTQYNRDDGIFIGGGFQYIKHGWRKEPWAQQHSLKANLAFSTFAFNIYYNGTFNDVIGKWDWTNDLVVQKPFGVSNYFGMGNESVFDVKGRTIPVKDDVIDYYRIHFQRINLFSGFSHSLGQKAMLKIGPEYLQYKLEDNSGRFISSPQSDLDQSRIYQAFQYVGGRVSLEVDARNNSQLPMKGIYLQAKYSSYTNITKGAKDYSQLSGEFDFYFTVRLPLLLTIANRIGGTANFGDAEFFNGATLGKETLRGYRRTRFIGQDAVYHNLDLRLKLASFRTYLFPGSVGLLGFHDVGRVWLKGEKSSAWHNSIGVGVWVAPIDKWVLAFNMAFTEDENLPSLTAGFQF